MSLKILLLQARNYGDLAKGEERQSFADKAGLDLEQIVAHDLLECPPTLQEVRRYDALMVGGSGDYYVSKGNLPCFSEALDLLREVVACGHPTFASCFGFQLLVKALGGEIVNDVDGMEVGTYDLTLTEAGQQDELLSVLPHNFRAQLGRKDRASRLPPGTINLAYSKRCPFQAMRIPGVAVWATQFHPELTVEDNLLRFSRYKDVYAELYSPPELKALVDGFVPSPETEELIPRFIKTVFG